MRQELSPIDANNVHDKRKVHYKEQAGEENIPEKLYYKEFEMYEQTFLWDFFKKRV